MYVQIENIQKQDSQNGESKIKNKIKLKDFHIENQYDDYIYNQILYETIVSFN